MGRSRLKILFAWSSSREAQAENQRGSLSRRLVDDGDNDNSNDNSNDNDNDNGTGNRDEGQGNENHR